MAQDSMRSGVKSIETTLEIIGYLDVHERGRLKNIADAIGVGTSTVHRHLTTLRDRGYVILENGEYRLSLKFLGQAGRIRNKIPKIDLIRQKVHQVSEDTGERAQFFVEEAGDRVFIFTLEGENAVNTDATIGKRGPLHVSAGGKAILANLPKEQQEEILSTTSLEGKTKNSIVEQETLRSELEEIRTQGYALNNQESTEGLRAVGVPVYFNDDRLLGSVSISGPANRLTDEYFHEELPNYLLGSVNELELNLRYS